MTAPDRSGDPQQPTATINDVAALAGVSIKTVSRVLNREPNVRPETTAKVLAAVEALSYRPNASARSLATGRSYLIGMFHENPNVHYVSGLEHGALAACRRLGYHLLVDELDGNRAEAARRVGALARQTRLDGAILSPPVCDSPEILAALQEAGTPIVRIAPYTQPARTPSVWIDDRQAAYDLTWHLLALGHREIGFIKGHPDHGASHWRYDGFVRAMMEAGAPVRPDLILQGDFSFASGEAGARILLSRAVRPTAIFAANDDMAAAVVATAHRMGIPVPGGLSVTGFDDTPTSAHFWPPITTVAQPIPDLAAQAVELIDRLRRKALRPGEASVRLEHRLILRESTGEPIAPTAEPPRAGLAVPG